MSDPRWNHLPNELKSLGKKSPDTPADPAAFKERVLREYERRAAFHHRVRWLRQGMVVVGVCTAVVVGFLVAKPVVVQHDPSPSPSTAKQAQPPIEEVVYEASNVPNLPTQELTFLDATSAQKWLSTANLPSDKQIDPAREVGYYLLNGSLQSMTLSEGDLQVKISHVPGHLQVLRIPLTRLKLSGLSGKMLTIHIYDESGTTVVATTQVKVP
ncbi:hypothetical protein JJB07_08850 [Tumebacillus sp. ITR2]|uniref:Uncharacterized protein n=1 Tax=Tumebacillus amylolyticus TaxID=2801339 RepID=A0ABS1J933_9BACL|nr:hypothetical protein [Tumebacillus amylolyticus]MBL0386759.1 hypothetical protein [Tumebacillus amylolyticus]